MNDREALADIALSAGLLQDIEAWKMKLFRVSGYCRVTATTAPTYSLNNACAGPANLSASTSPLDVRSPCSGDGECGKGATDFHDLSRAASPGLTSCGNRPRQPAIRKSLI